jgi:hypothetical protein
LEGQEGSVKILRTEKTNKNKRPIKKTAKKKAWYFYMASSLIGIVGLLIVFVLLSQYPPQSPPCLTV